jgi:hypothetical protein
MLNVSTSVYETNGTCLQGGCMRRVNWLGLWWLKVTSAFILYSQRRQAGISLDQAAVNAGINAAVLRKYETGRAWPPMCLVFDLLKLYRANSHAQFFFCIAPVNFFASIRIVLASLSYTAARRNDKLEKWATPF